jgi:hypothetical protein
MANSLIFDSKSAIENPVPKSGVGTIDLSLSRRRLEISKAFDVLEIILKNIIS